MSKHSSTLYIFGNHIFDFPHGSPPGRPFFSSFFFYMPVTAEPNGSQLKERATSHRWLPDSWVNRKEIFPCLTWLKLSTDLPLLSFSVHMAEHWYRTSMGRAKDFSKASCDVLVVTPLCPSTVSSLLWAHMPLTQLRSHHSGASAFTVPNEWEADNQQRLSSTPSCKCQIREHANSSVNSAFYCNCWQDSNSIFN